MYQQIRDPVQVAPQISMPFPTDQNREGLYSIRVARVVLSNAVMKPNKFGTRGRMRHSGLARRRPFTGRTIV